MKNPPIPSQFQQKLIEIQQTDRSNPDNRHIRMDEYLCKTLESLGYSDGIRVYRSTIKNY